MTLSSLATTKVLEFVFSRPLCHYDDKLTRPLGRITGLYMHSAHTEGINTCLSASPVSYSLFILVLYRTEEYFTYVTSACIIVSGNRTMSWGPSPLSRLLVLYLISINHSQFSNRRSVIDHAMYSPFLQQVFQRDVPGFNKLLCVFSNMKSVIGFAAVECTIPVRRQLELH